MGQTHVTRLKSKKDRANYIHHLLNDLKALDQMIENDMIESGSMRIGAEQELCIVNNQFFPDGSAQALLKAINDDHFTTEISNFNLELNLDPLILEKDCFSKLHKQLTGFLEKAKSAAAKKQLHLILTGILPSLSVDKISINNLTNRPRYQLLNEALKKYRSQDFDVHIKGVDEVNLKSDSVILEGCNTSFQMHLQLSPKSFVDDYNWAQAIAGPVLSICVNAPILFGKELWKETRIALFTQSVDTRVNSFLLNEKQSRVNFGNDWQTGSISDIFKDNISRFRSFLNTNFSTDSTVILEEGKIPKLKALALQNGTVYPWNRVCYGVLNDRPNLRIENRYIPSGPTTVDEIANMVFWVGLMLGRSKMYDQIHNKWDFKDVKTNFFNAARYGMASQFYWNGEYIPSAKLILHELLPMAHKGLKKAGINLVDIDYYLNIIKHRVEGYTGSEWLIRNYRSLLKTHKRYDAMQILTAKMYEKQEKGYPVSVWGKIPYPEESPFKDERVVKHIMSFDIFSVTKKDSIKLVLQIMLWKNIHHMPVIGNNRTLEGLLTWSDLKTYSENPHRQDESVISLMKTNLITTEEHVPIKEAKVLMDKHKVGCLPVLRNQKLIGLITRNDLN